MSSHLPTDEDVGRFLDFTGLDPYQYRSTAFAALKELGDVTRAITEYWNDADGFKKRFTWDESVFSASRDGSSPQGTANAATSFHVEAADPIAMEGVTTAQGTEFLHPPTAPSRPPSRTNNQTPQANWYFEDSGAEEEKDKLGGKLTIKSLAVPATQAEADAQMERALRESAAESGYDLTPQDSGVIDIAHNVSSSFGPATRDSYEEGIWDIVPLANDVVVSDSSLPRPSLRKRLSGSPSFIVSGERGGDKLGGLLTILHSIPLARNTLLQMAPPATSYGHNNEWWKGEKILPPDTLVAIQNNTLPWGEIPKPDFGEEVHRLMAFLDLSERSYCSAQSLIELTQASNGKVEKAFYEQAGALYPDKLGPFSHTVTTRDIQTDEPDSDSISFAVIEMDSQDLVLNGAKSLWDAWDQMMWGDSLHAGTLEPGHSMAMFENIGDVIAVQLLGNDDSSRLLQIPESWCPERYMRSRKKEAIINQQYICWAKTKTQQLKDIDDKIFQWHSSSTDKSINIADLCEQAISKLKRQIQYIEDHARFAAYRKGELGDSAYTKDSSNTNFAWTPEQESLVHKCRQRLDIYEQVLVDSKSVRKWMDRELALAQNMRQYASKTLIDPTNCGLETPVASKQFSLRGVTFQNTTFMCKRGDADETDLSRSSQSAFDQWWKLAYNQQDSTCPVNIEKVEVGDVMRELKETATNPLLVYATDDALLTPAVPLWDSLNRFVRAENKSFQQELNQEKSDSGTYRGSELATLISSSKRKQRSSSTDTMATDVAFQGDSDHERAMESDAFGYADTDYELDAAQMMGLPSVRDTPKSWLQPSQNDEFTKSGWEEESKENIPVSKSEDFEKLLSNTESSELLTKRDQEVIPGQVDVATPTVDAKIEMHDREPEMQQKDGAEALMAASLIGNGSTERDSKG